MLLAALLIGVSLAALPASAVPPLAGDGYQCTTSAGPSDSDTATKIMITGDSITNASAGDYTWPYWLWKNQVAKGANIDFVGSFQDTVTANTGASGSRAYLDCDFDQDRETRPGVKLYTKASNVAGGTYGLATPTGSNVPFAPYYPSATSWIRGATQAHNPEILVVFAGANDLARTTQETEITDKSEAGIATFAINRLKDVIVQARLGRPGIDIVITTVPPSNLQRFGLYNAKLPDVVSDLNTNDQRVVLANLPSWFLHSWDGLHPDAIGEVAIAAEIADKLNVIKPSALFTRPNPLPAPAVGPRFPAQLTTVPDGENRVKLTWTLPPGADRTVIYYRKTGATTWTKKEDLVKATLRDYYPNEGTASCAVVCTTYTFTQLSGGGASYDFMVMLGKGRSVATSIGSNVETEQVQGSVVLGKTTILTPTVGVHSATVRWNPVDDATGYEVRYRVAGSGTYAMTPSASTPKMIGNLVAGRKYGFQVRARTAQAIGPWSNETTAVPKANALGTGKKPVLSKVKGQKIKATWSASAGANKYQLQRRAVGGSWKTVATTTSRKVTSGKLKKGKTYEFRVRPYDGDVAGKYSPTKRRKVT